MNLSENQLLADADSVRTVMTVAVFAMASLAETRDSDSVHHIQRVQHYIKALAQQLKKHPRFTAVLTDPCIDLLFELAPLYDMGTIGIPDRILLKPSRLTPAEFTVMRTHTELASMWWSRPKRPWVISQTSF